MRRSSHLQESKREERRAYYTCCGSISALSSAALGSLRSYCLVGSGTSTKMGRDGVSSLQMTRDDLLTWSTSFFHAIYLGLPKNLTPVSPAHLRPTNKRHRRRRGKRRRPARPRERKRRHRGDGLRGDIGGWTWEVGAAAADCQGHRPSTQASGG